MSDAYRKVVLSDPLVYAMVNTNKSMEEIIVAMHERHKAQLAYTDKLLMSRSEPITVCQTCGTKLAEAILTYGTERV